MRCDRQIGLAVGGSLLAHLLLAGGATTMLAIQRASPPDNDAFSDARRLRGEWGGASFGDSTYATRESGEPVHAAGAAGGSVWWRWRSPAAPCVVEVQVVGDGFEEVVGVYRGAVLQTLSEVVSRAAGDGAVLEFVAEPGTLYHVVVAGASAGDAGEIELRLRASPDLEGVAPEEIVLLLPELLSFEAVEVEPPDDPAFSRAEGEELPAPPADARRQSDRDREAAGELPPEEDGEEGVGTQDGEELPFAPPLEVAPLWQTEAGPSPSADGFTQVPEIEVPTVEPEEVAPPAEPAEPAEPVVSAFEADTAAAAVEDVAAAAMPEAAAAGAPAEAAEHAPPSRPEAVKARTIGKAEAGGEAAVATAETALGRYQAEIDRGVQASSRRARAARGGFDEFGFLKVRMWVNREGAVVNTKVLFSQATPEMVEVTLRGLREAEIPPMPDEVYSAAADGLVDMVYEVFY